MLRQAYLSTQRCLFFGRKQALQLPQREAEQNSQSFCLHRRRILFPGDLKYKLSLLLLLLLINFGSEGSPTI
jgi:hypothetical protein